MYLDGAKFTIETDHQALSRLFRVNNPAGRLACWALMLQKYEYSIVYRKGATNTTADALSRAPLPGQQQPTPAIMAVSPSDKPWRTIITRKQLLEAQRADDQCTQILRGMAETVCQ